MLDREDFIKTCNSKLKLVRTEFSFSQDKMAVMLGISKKTLVEIEKGRSSLGWSGSIVLILSPLKAANQNITTPTLTEYGGRLLCQIKTLFLNRILFLNIIELLIKTLKLLRHRLILMTSKK